MAVPPLHTEQRRYPRQSVRVDAIFSPDGTQIEDGIVHDLSQGGCRIVSAWQPSAGSSLQLQLRPQNHIFIYIPQAAVQWVKDGAFGVTFIQVPDLEASTLTRFLWSFCTTPEQAKPFLTVKALKGMNMSMAGNRRKFPRFALHCPIALLTEGVTLGDGLCYDLSGGGCAVESGAPVGKGDYVALHLYLPDQRGPTTPLTVELAAVRWLVQQRFGVEFIAIPSADQQRLRAYVDTRVVESMLFS
ncbi:MAG: PilZ domain-containing protein [Nitrospira sp.]|nr:PilZ domain-containing protein [Nitrospira sp.]